MLVDPLLLPLYGGGYDAAAMDAAPEVMEYSTILSAQLPWPNESGWGFSRGLYVLLRGAHLYGAASCICSVTETPYVVTGGDDPDPEPGPGPIPEPDPGPGPDDPPDPDPIDPEPDPDPGWVPPPPGPAPGPTPGPTPTPDPDPDPDPSDPERPVVGWWYKAGDGLSVSAAKKVGKNYQFDVTAPGFAADDTEVLINAYVDLTASGGGSGLGGKVNWGFDRETGALALTAKTDNQWTASGWQPATPPSPTAQDYRSVPAKITTGVRQGEFIACSNIFLRSDDAILVKKSTQYINRTIDGEKVKFQVCYITFRKKRLQKLIAQNALAACPLDGHTVSPASATGTISQSGEAPPSVKASAGKAECKNSRPSVKISAPWRLRYSSIREEASSKMTVSGGSEWNAADGRYSGELSQDFTISLPEKTFKNY